MGLQGGVTTSTCALIDIYGTWLTLRRSSAAPSAIPILVLTWRGVGDGGDLAGLRGSGVRLDSEGHGCAGGTWGPRLPGQRRRDFAADPRAAVLVGHSSDLCAALVRLQHPSREWDGVPVHGPGTAAPGPQRGVRVPGGHQGALLPAALPPHGVRAALQPHKRAGPGPGGAHGALLQRGRGRRAAEGQGRPGSRAVHHAGQRGPGAGAGRAHRHPRVQGRPPVLRRHELQDRGPAAPPDHAVAPNPLHHHPVRRRHLPPVPLAGPDLRVGLRPLLRGRRGRT